MLRAMAEPRSDSLPTSANELIRLSYRDAQSLFRKLPAPSVDEMNGEYRAELLDQGPAPFLWIASFVVHLKGRWFAKAFTPEGPKGGRGYNAFVIGHRVVRGSRMRTYVGPSRYDKQPSYHLDYSAYNRGLLGTMRDEIRQVREGLYLGLGMVGYTRLMRRPSPFILEGPVASFVD